MDIKLPPGFTRRAGVAALALLLGACSVNSKDSTKVETGNIYLNVQLFERSGSNSTKITANLHSRDKTGSSLALADGEYITAEFGGQEIQLEKDEELLEIDYDGRIETTAEGGRFTITLHRASGDSHSFYIDMPPSFTVAEPSPGDIYHEDSEVELLWAPPLPSALINIHGHIACESIEDDLELDIDNENETWLTADVGVFLVPVDQLAANIRRETALEDEELLAGNPCEFDLEVYRETQKSLADAFAEGSAIIATKTTAIDGMTLFISPD